MLGQVSSAFQIGDVNFLSAMQFPHGLSVEFLLWSTFFCCVTPILHNTNSAYVVIDAILFNILLFKLPLKTLSISRLPAPGYDQHFRKATVMVCAS